MKLLSPHSVYFLFFAHPKECKVVDVHFGKEDYDNDTTRKCRNREEKRE